MPHYHLNMVSEASGFPVLAGVSLILKALKKIGLFQPVRDSLQDTLETPHSMLSSHQYIVCCSLNCIQYFLKLWLEEYTLLLCELHL